MISSYFTGSPRAALVEGRGVVVDIDKDGTAQRHMSPVSAGAVYIVY